MKDGMGFVTVAIAVAVIVASIVSMALDWPVQARAFLVLVATCNLIAIHWHRRTRVWRAVTRAEA